MSDHYTYRTIWSQEDGSYVALCGEFPSLSWVEETPEQAEVALKAIVAVVVADMEANCEPLPQARSN